MTQQNRGYYVVSGTGRAFTREFFETIDAAMAYAAAQDATTGKQQRVEERRVTRGGLPTCKTIHRTR